KASAFARDGRRAPHDLRPSWRAAARFSSSLAGGARFARVLILRHIGVLLESPYAWFTVLVLRDAGLGRVPFSDLQPWGQRIAQPIADKVEAHHGEGDHDAREDRQPGIEREVALRVVQHVAPTGRGRLDTVAKEADV